MEKLRIRITLVDRIGPHGCHRGHKIGDSFDYDTERGKLCPLAMHVAFPYTDILHYGGTLPPSGNGEFRFCCVRKRSGSSSYLINAVMSRLISLQFWNYFFMRIITKETIETHFLY